MKKEKQISCHSQVFLSGISTVCEQRKWKRSSNPAGRPTFEDDPRRSLAGKVRGGLYPSPVAGEGRGFTLIELLIAVIIIGVLVAVAVPQYQKAVLKSRFSSLMPLGKALLDGNEDYYLRNGKYTNDINQLDIKAIESEEVTLGNEETHKYVKLTRSDMENNLMMYQKHSPNFAGEIHCEAKMDSSIANWLCRDSLQGILVGNKYGYNIYSLSGEPNGKLGRIIYGAGGDMNFKDGDVCVPTASYNFSKNNQACAYGGIFENSTCIADSRYMMGCAHSKFYNNSVCEGHSIVSGYPRPACGDNTAQYYASTCNGYEGSWSCGFHAGYSQGSTCNGMDVTGGDGACSLNARFNDSTCNGYGLNSCSTSNQYNRSTCNGQSSSSCSGSTFSNGSVCNAYTLGACSGNTYKTGSYCSGKYCPEGAASSTAGKVWHREKGWGDDKESVLVDLPA